MLLSSKIQPRTLVSTPRRLPRARAWALEAKKARARGEQTSDKTGPLVILPSIDGVWADPILKSVLREPVAFIGGAVAGVLGFDLSADPLKGWIKRTSEPEKR